MKIDDKMVDKMMTSKPVDIKGKKAGGRICIVMCVYADEHPDKVLAPMRCHSCDCKLLCGQDAYTKVKEYGLLCSCLRCAQNMVRAAEAKGKTIPMSHLAEQNEKIEKTKVQIRQQKPEGLGG